MLFSNVFKTDKEGYFTVGAYKYQLITKEDHYRVVHVDSMIFLYINFDNTVADLIDIAKDQEVDKYYIPIIEHLKTIYRKEKIETLVMSE